MHSAVLCCVVLCCAALCRRHIHMLALRSIGSPSFIICIIGTNTCTCRNLFAAVQQSVRLWLAWLTVCYVTIRETPLLKPDLCLKSLLTRWWMITTGAASSGLYRWQQYLYSSAAGRNCCYPRYCFQRVMSALQDTCAALLLVSFMCFCPKQVHLIRKTRRIVMP